MLSVLGTFATSFESELHNGSSTRVSHDTSSSFGILHIDKWDIDSLGITFERIRNKYDEIHENKIKEVVVRCDILIDIWDNGSLFVPYIVV
jgi:hypothetical protein